MIRLTIDTKTGLEWIGPTHAGDFGKGEDELARLNKLKPEDEEESEPDDEESSDPEKEDDQEKEEEEQDEQNPTSFLHWIIWASSNNPKFAVPETPHYIS